MKRTARFLVLAALMLALVLNASAAFALTSVYGYDKLADYLKLPGMGKFDETVTLKVVGTDTRPDSDLTPDTFDRMNALNNEILLERFNIQLDWQWIVSADQYQQKLTLSFASGDYPDILQCDAATYKELRKSDVLVELSDLWEQCGLDDLKVGFDENGITKAMYEDDGSLYTIPEPVVNSAGMLFIDYREDWIEKLGYQAFPATLEELKPYLIACATQDPDGNGVADTYGLRGMMNPYDGYGLLGIFWAHDAYPGAWLLKDGAIVSGTIQSETLETLKYLAELYEAGAIDPEYATLTYEQVLGRSVAGQYGVLVQSMYSQWETVRPHMNSDPTALWGRAKIPTHEAGREAVQLYPEKVIGAYNVALTTAPKAAAEAMLKIINNTVLTFIWGDVDLTGFPELEDNPAARTNGYYHYWFPVYVNPVQMQWDLWKDTAMTWTTGDTQYAARQNRLGEYGWAQAWENATAEERVNWANEEYPDRGTAYVQWDGFTDTGRCGIVYNNMVNGNYIYNVDYGSATETIVKAGSTINDYVYEYFHRFIMGQVDESSWEEFVTQWNALGGEAITAEVNAAYTALH